VVTERRCFTVRAQFETAHTYPIVRLRHPIKAAPLRSASLRDELRSALTEAPPPAWLEMRRRAKEEMVVHTEASSNDVGGVNAESERRLASRALPRLAVNWPTGGREAFGTYVKR